MPNAKLSRLNPKETIMIQSKMQIHNRQSRRQVVLISYGSAAIGLIAAILDPRSSQPLLSLLLNLVGATSVLVSLIYLFRLLNPKLMGTSDGPDHDLDERQLQTRNQAYVSAYRVLGGALILIVPAVLLWSAFGSLPKLDIGAIAALSYWAVLLVATLPSAVLAWLEPDPIGE
jgi:hypothetical protein